METIKENKWYEVEIKEMFIDTEYEETYVDLFFDFIESINLGSIICKCILIPLNVVGEEQVNHISHRKEEIKILHALGYNLRDYYDKETKCINLPQDVIGRKFQVQFKSYKINGLETLKVFKVSKTKRFKELKKV